MNPNLNKNRQDADTGASFQKPGRTHKIYVAEGSDPPIELLLNKTGCHLSTISEADCIVYPYLIRDQNTDIRERISQISRQYISYDKKVIIFILSDYDGRYPFYKNLVLFRTSAKANKLAINEYIMPYLWECKHEPFTPVLSDDPALPSIGFCGQVHKKYRKKLISTFENSSLVNCRFVKRNAFWGGKPQDAGLMTDFWNNMLQNQFALAPRGGGNFSMRFYQALSVGRIPVLINTNMTLPFSNLIPWKDFIVFEKNEKQCVRRLREIFDAGKVVAVQKMCYQMFHDYLSPRVFLGHVLRQLNITSENKPLPWWKRW
jgi:hypothetical protein